MPAGVKVQWNIGKHADDDRDEDDGDEGDGHDVDDDGGVDEKRHVQPNVTLAVGHGIQCPPCYFPLSVPASLDVSK